MAAVVVASCVATAASGINGRYHDDKLEESVAEVLLHRSQKKSGAPRL